ncbi:MAG TPA: BON domain-containing protein [Stellaceae bacterium]|nr:BON domain-containing protein [Stellaceae bacterium]
MAHRSLVTTILVAALAGAGAASLGGCVIAAVGAAGAGGGYALSQERSLSDTARDAGIHAVIAQAWKKYNVKMFEDLDTTVYEGRVLITGDVPTEEWRAEAVKLAWQTDRVKEVYDEIQVGPEEGFGQDMGDTAITSKLKTQIIADADVKSINYTVTTVKGVVYIIGSARSQAEIDRVIDHARNIGDVRRVVSYVRIRTGEPPKAEAQGTPRPSAPPPGAAPPGPPPGASDAVSMPTPRQEIQVQPLQ